MNRCFHIWNTTEPRLFRCNFFPSGWITKSIVLGWRLPIDLPDTVLKGAIDSHPTLAEGFLRPYGGGEAGG